MCFRPPDVDGGVECPACGKKVHPANGVLPKKCPFCKTRFDPEAASVGVDSPKTPTMPGAPGAPAVPGAPKAPGAPV